MIPASRLAKSGMTNRVLSLRTTSDYERAMDPAPPLTTQHSTLLGVLCGAGAALCWSLGFVAARQGILAGVSPLVLALHRYVWPGLALIPVLAADGFGDLGGMGWRRGVVITIFGGLPLALWSYYGYVYVPLGHGAIIQPSCAALGGLVLASLVLKENLPPRRIVGALAMVAGLVMIGIEALHTMGAQGLLGDMFFVAAGGFFAVFGICLLYTSSRQRLWRRCWRATASATWLTATCSAAGRAMQSSIATVSPITKRWRGSRSSKRGWCASSPMRRGVAHRAPSA